MVLSSVVPRQSSRVCEHLMKQLSMVISLSIYTHLDGRLNMVEPRSLFLLLPFDMLTFCWHASTLFKTKKCMLLNSDISGLPSVVSGRFCQRNFVTMSLELWSRFESSSTWHAPPRRNRPVICVLNGKLINEHKGKYMKIYESERNATNKMESKRPSLE